MATLTISLPAQFIDQVDLEAKEQGSTRSEFFRALLRKYFSSETQFKVFTPKPLEDMRHSMLKTGKYNRKFVDSVIAGLADSSVYGH